MKKLFALVLALCLLCGCTALAENVISWEDVAPMVEASGVSGQFYTFDQIAVKIWIPDGVVQAELPDESYIGYFVDANGDKDTISVQYVNVDGMDLETYAAAAANVGCREIEMGTVNGLPCVTYELTQQDGSNSFGIAFTTEAGYILEVVVAPVDDEDAKTGAGFILASIQPE